jgi:release factor glutamine methyltransferase
VISAAVKRLTAAGSDSPRLDAQLLLMRALGTTREGLVRRGDELLPTAVQREFEALLERREAGEPVAYILGFKAFRNFELVVDRRVLVPRPDTETLVDQAFGYAPLGGRVHDVGTGSGAVALALKDERPDLTVTASDVSPDAVDVARANAARLGIDVPIVVADGLPPGDYDVVVANLPYVREDEWDGLPPDIREHEPRLALVSGADGLDAIRSLVTQARPGTLLVLEHAPAQAEAVRALLVGARTERDLAGRDRVTLGRAP